MMVDRGEASRSSSRLVESGENQSCGLKIDQAVASASEIYQFLCIASVLCARLRDLRLSDPSSTLHQVPLPLLSAVVAVDTGSYTRTCIYTRVYIERARGEPPFQWWFCKIVAETRMLDDDEIDAGTKAGKKPSGFFHFRNDARILLCRAVSVGDSFMDMDENELFFIFRRIN